MAEITRLLPAALAGDATAADALYSRVYAELCRLAGQSLSRHAGSTQLDAPSLVHEAYLRMAEQEGLAFANRRAFFGYAAQVMRNVLVDHVRERSADKRGGGLEAVTMLTSVEDPAAQAGDLMAIDSALQALGRLDARSHDIFEMHFFAGLPVEDIGGLLSLSPATVKRELRKARAFLEAELGGPTTR